jgi:hypothetical protein
MLRTRTGEALSPHLKTTTDSWKVDETYMKIRKIWMYLYGTVDSQENMIEFFLSPTRDAEAAKRFFLKALHVTACSTPPILPREECITSTHPITTSVPRVINVDKNAAIPKPLPS